MKFNLRTAALYGTMPVLLGMIVLALGPMKEPVYALFAKINTLLDTGLAWVADIIRPFFMAFTAAVQAVLDFLASNPGVRDLIWSFWHFALAPVAVAFAFIFARRARFSTDSNDKGYVIDVIGGLAAAASMFWITQYLSDVHVTSSLYQNLGQSYFVEKFAPIPALLFVFCILGVIESTKNDAIKDRQKHFLALHAKEINLPKESAELTEAIEKLTGLDVDGDGNRPAPEHVSVKADGDKTIKLEDVPLQPIKGIARTTIALATVFIGMLYGVTHLHINLLSNWNNGLQYGMGGESLKAAVQANGDDLRNFYLPGQPEKSAVWLLEDGLTVPAANDSTADRLIIRDEAAGYALTCSIVNGQMMVQNGDPDGNSKVEVAASDGFLNPVLAGICFTRAGELNAAPAPAATEEAPDRVDVTPMPVIELPQAPVEAPAVLEEPVAMPADIMPATPAPEAPAQAAEPAQQAEHAPAIETEATAPQQGFSPIVIPMIKLPAEADPKAPLEGPELDDAPAADTQLN